LVPTKIEFTAMSSPLSDRLSATEAAQLACVDKSAISHAVKREALRKGEDGKFLRADVVAWVAGRRTSRGGRRKVELARLPGEASSTHAPAQTEWEPPTLAEVLIEAHAVSIAIESGAGDMAVLCGRHLPIEVIRPLVDEWVHQQRVGWVGAPGELESAAEVAQWPAPPEGGTWQHHKLFTGDPLRAEWDAIEGEISAWKAAQATEAHE
jgi:hypothetical protein